MRHFLHPAAFVVLALTACNHQKCVSSSSQTSFSDSTSQTATTNTTVTTASADSNVTTTVQAPPQNADTSNIYRVTVSFISKGEGIDYKKAQDFEKWVAEYPGGPKYVKTHWGREGETNYCLKLNELSTRQQDIFVRDLRTFLSGNELVIVDEYAPCKGTPE